MPKFIKCHSSENGAEILINIKKIIVVFENKGSNNSIIEIKGGIRISVKETVEVIESNILVA